MPRRAPFSECVSGIIAEMLTEAYEALLVELPVDRREELLADWRCYDIAVHDEPGTVGSAGFLTLHGGAIIGFGSWDPRGWPDVGHIGHNCILPDQQGQGFGRQQIEEILKIFRGKGFRLARVRTDEHPFFTPARRMYAACGFREVGREPGTLLEDCDTVVYELDLTT